MTETNQNLYSKFQKQLAICIYVANTNVKNTQVT